MKSLYGMFLAVFVAMAVLLVSVSAKAEGFSFQERRILESANGFWANSSGDEAWRFALGKDGTFAMAMGDWSVSNAKVLEIYPEHKTFNLVINGEVASVKVSSGYMTLTDDNGRVYMASFVRPLNQRDWDFMESIWFPADRGCGMFNQFC